MDDSKFKELLKQSELKTSEDFMDRLMDKLETTESEAVRVKFPKLIPLLFLGTIMIQMGLWLLGFTLPNIDLAGSIPSIKIPLMLLTGFFMIWNINRFLNLRHATKL